MNKQKDLDLLVNLSLYSSIRHPLFITLVNKMRCHKIQSKDVLDTSVNGTFNTRIWVNNRPQHIKTTLHFSTRSDVTFSI